MDSLSGVPTYDRRRIAVTLESYEGWRSFTRNYGGNPTVLAEVIGLHLASIDVPRSKLPPLWRQLADEATALEEERRQRAGDD